MIPKSWVSDAGSHSVPTPSKGSLGLLLRSDLDGGCLPGNLALGLLNGSGYSWPDQVEGDKGGPDLWILPTTPFCRRFSKRVYDLLTSSSFADSITVILVDAGKTSHAVAVSAAADTEAATAFAVGSIPVFRTLHSPAIRSMPEFRGTHGACARFHNVVVGSTHRADLLGSEYMGAVITRGCPGQNWFSLAKKENADNGFLPAGMWREKSYGTGLAKAEPNQVIAADFGDCGTDAYAKYVDGTGSIVVGCGTGSGRGSIVLHTDGGYSGSDSLGQERSSDPCPTWMRLITKKSVRNTGMCSVGVLRKSRLAPNKDLLGLNTIQAGCWRLV